MLRPDPMTITLPLHCSSCGVLLNVKVKDWTDGSAPQHESIVCPVCQDAGTILVPGQIVNVSRRPQDDKQTGS